MKILWILTGIIIVETAINFIHHIKAKKSSFIIIHILKLQHKIMGQVDEMRIQIAAIKDSFTKIAADLDRIAGGISPTGGLTEAEAEEIKAELTSLATSAKALDDRNQEPTVEPV